MSTLSLRTERLSTSHQSSSAGGYLACASKNCQDANDALVVCVVDPTSARTSGALGQVWPPPSTLRSTTAVPAAHGADVERRVTVPSPVLGSTSCAGPSWHPSAW